MSERPGTALTVRPVEPRDFEVWLQMRLVLWPVSTEAEHRDELQRYFDGAFSREPWSALLAEDDAEGPVGFVELSIRPFAEGCWTDRVAYLEGWFVRSRARGRGVGKALVVAAEDWARSQGCAELASDAEPENEVSASAHRALGFDDVGLVRCFRKDL